MKKINLKKEVKKNSNSFVTDTRSLTTEEYIKLHCKKNHWFPTPFIVNGKEFVA